MTDNAKILLGKAPLNEANGLKARLARSEIEVLLVHNEVTCNKGCSLQVEIWAHPADVQEIGRLLATEREQRVESLGYDPRLMDVVFDASAAMVTCPACGTSFAPTSNTCPECELCFGGDEIAAPASGCGTGKKSC